MVTAVNMPRWGMIMEEGLILEWLKKEGDEIAIGEPLLVVESEKAANEVAAPEAGVIRAILLPEGETAAVGALLAVIASPDEDAGAVKDFLAQYSPAFEGAPSQLSKPSPIPTPVASASAPKPKRVMISPAAKRIAEEQGIAWQNLEGSGPRGRIERKDVVQAIEAAQAAAEPALTAGERMPLSQMRKAITRSMLHSIQAPQAALCREIDITSMLHYRKSLMDQNLDMDKPPTVTAIAVKASAMALGEVPILNARLDNDSIWMNDKVNIGVVVAVDDGVVVPVIRDTNSKSLLEVAAELNELAQRARVGNLTTAEMEGGTFTISNAGPLGIDFFQALLFTPQVGALGLGRGRQRAVVVNGQVAVRMMSYFCVSSDHRVVDAEPIGRFLDHMNNLMQNPELLLESKAVQS